MMEYNRRLLLKAIKHNWGLLGAGDWSKVTWTIFRDGSYEVITTFNPSRESLNEIENLKTWDDIPKSVEKKDSGMMADSSFAKLREVISREQWRDPSLSVQAFDGVAWEIRSYCEDGSVENTSGKLDYIYGHRILETIVSLLPSNGYSCCSSAYVAIERKVDD